MSGWSPPMETVARQRSCSDPSNPPNPERNDSVYGESDLTTA